jgi:hypothetical protein
VAVEELLNSKGNEVVLSTEGSVPFNLLVKAATGSRGNVVLLLSEEGSVPLLVVVLLKPKIGNRNWGRGWANVVPLLSEEGSVPLLVVVLLESKLGNWVNVVLLLPEEGSAPLLKRLSPVPVDEEGSVPL